MKSQVESWSPGAQGGSSHELELIARALTFIAVQSFRHSVAVEEAKITHFHAPVPVLTDAQILLGGGFVRFPRDQPEAGPFLRRAVVGMERLGLLVARLVRVARFAEVGHEVEDRFVDAHILTRVVLRKDRSTLDQRQPEDVRQILAPDAAQSLPARKETQQGKRTMKRKQTGTGEGIANEIEI
uniref:Uncharacterized protein n=1 Tax=Anopheles farauti TaxID=69004 RepID=A0A182QRZ1_9DIPT